MDRKFEPVMPGRQSQLSPVPEVMERGGAAAGSICRDSARSISRARPTPPARLIPSAIDSTAMSAYPPCPSPIFAALRS